MIAHLKGLLADVSEECVVLDAGGVGYEVHVPGSTLARLPPQGEALKLYTYMALRQDAITLYGFLTAAEQRLFCHLISVQGVGPRMALAVLSVMSPDGFFQAMLNEDVDALTSVPGVGPKTARRMILDLRDKIGAKKKIAKKGRDTGRAQADGPVAQSVDALMALGYGRTEALSAVESCISELGDAPLVEDVIRAALRRLSRL